MEEPKDFYTRLVAFAFEAKVPGATAHDRLRYLNELLKKHRFKIVDEDLPLHRAVVLKLVDRLRARKT